MAYTPGNNPEQPQQNPPSSGETTAGQPASKPTEAGDTLTKNFQTELAKKREKHEARIDEQEKKFRQTGTIGKANTEKMSARQVNRLRTIASAKETQFAALLATQKAERHQMILGEAEGEMMAISENYIKIIDHVRGLDKLDEYEMVRLEAIMEALAKMKTDAGLEKIFHKALNKTALSPQEMGYLVDKINPVELGGGSLETAQQKTPQIFEAGQAGAIISLLTGTPQFMRLMEAIIQKKSPAETQQIMDILLTVGVLSNLQLQNLIDRGLLPAETAGALQTRLESGELAEKQSQYRQMMEQQGEQNKGRTADNPLNKSFSGPGAMAIAGLWGIATALVNIKAGWERDNGIGKNIADAVTNPYVLLGLGVAAGSVAVVAPVVAPELAEKYKDKFVDFWKGPEGKREALNIREQQLRDMMEGQLVRNPYLLAFLEEKEEVDGGRQLTGLEVIKELVANQQAANKPVSITFTEIMAHSRGKQKALLTKAMAQEGGKAINFEDTIRAVMASLTHLKLDNPTSLTQLSADIKTKQGIA